MEVLANPLEQVLKTMSTGKIIIMDLNGTINATAWGGLASKLAQNKGCLGNNYARNIQGYRRNS